MVLGSPYLYDKKSIFYREHNRYHLYKDGIKFNVRAHHVKNDRYVVNTRHMKMIVNSSNSLTLMSITTSDTKHEDLNYDKV